MSRKVLKGASGAFYFWKASAGSTVRRLQSFAGIL